MIDRKAHALELQAFDAEYRTGALVVAGMDEVGRGPLAGNVVTACVVIPENPLIEWIDDTPIFISAGSRSMSWSEALSSGISDR